MNMGDTIDWGRTEYNSALQRQLERVEQRRAGVVPDALVFTEHDPVYTIGSRAGSAEHLIASQEFLSSEGISVVSTNRGGDITYHGPGQIVGYPILDLNLHGRDLHAYLRGLEEVLIRTVAHFGLKATRRDGKTGIWLEDRKIAAIGVAVKSWVSYHGFALNVTPSWSILLASFPAELPMGGSPPCLRNSAKLCCLCR